MFIALNVHKVTRLLSQNDLEVVTDNLSPVEYVNVMKFIFQARLIIRRLSMFTLTFPCSLLPFHVHSYLSMFTLTSPCSLLPFHVHSYLSMFTLTFPCSLLPFHVHSYLSMFTLTFQCSLLSLTFPCSLLPFHAHSYLSMFSLTFPCSWVLKSSRAPCQVQTSLQCSVLSPHCDPLLHISEGGNSFI